MAKQDFCFTYYDGDAARDKAHMNRLERGAYDDLISAQRKFGHLSKEIIQKILSGDFDKCWASLELILKVDQAGKFYIDWLETSIKKAAQHSKLQKEKIDKYWTERKNNGNTTVLPQNNSGINSEYTKEIPLEDGDVNGNEDEIGKGNENGKELPNPTQTACEVFFQQCGKTREEGEIFFHHYNKKNWVDGAGQKIFNWASLAQEWILNPKTNSNGAGAKIRNISEDQQRKFNENYDRFKPSGTSSL